MNTFDLNIKKCQKQVIFCSEKLANNRREKYRLTMLLSSNPTDKKIQEDYELYFQKEEWIRGDLRKANEELEKAYELKYK